MLGGGEDRHDEDAPTGGEPFEQAAEVVAGGGEDGVGGVAVGSGEVVWPMRCSDLAWPILYIALK